MQARLLWRRADCSATRSWISTPEKKRRDLPGPLKGDSLKAGQENFPRFIEEKFVRFLKEAVQKAEKGE